MFCAFKENLSTIGGLAYSFVVELEFYPSTLLSYFFVIDVFGMKNRRKVHTRGRNSMPSATSLVIRLADPYLQNLIVTMPMYVIIQDYFVSSIFEIIDMLHF